MLFYVAFVIAAAPIITIVSPTNTTYYNSTQNSTLILNVTTDILANVTYIFNGGNNTTLYTNSTQGNISLFSVEGENNLTIIAINATDGNTTNTTISYFVDTISPSFASITNNETDLFYSYCQNNSVITLLANVTETGINVTGNFSEIETGGNASLEFYDDGTNGDATSGDGVYTLIYNITSADKNFEASNITIDATDLANNTVTSTFEIISYNISLPTGFDGNTTDFCNITDFGNITDLILENTNLSRIDFTQTANLTDSEAELAQLSTFVQLGNASIYLNSTGLSALNLTANLTMYGINESTTPKIKRIDEIGNETDCIGLGVCANLAYNNTTQILTFNVTKFSNDTVDLDPPVASSGSPTGTDDDSTPAIGVLSDEYADCGYKLGSTSSDFSDYTLFSTTGQKTHNTTLGSQSDGTTQVYVLCNDTLGNVGTSPYQFSFSIDTDDGEGEGSGGSSGGGGGGGGSSGSGSDPSKTQQSKYWDVITSGSFQEITINKEKVALTEIRFTMKSTAFDAKLRVESFTKRPASVGTAPDTVYEYIEITTTGFSTTGVIDPRIEFEIPVEWFNDHNLDRDKVILYRYKNSDWNKLDTVRTGLKGASYTYRASSPGFSFFAISTVEIEASSSSSDTDNNDAGVEDINAPIEVGSESKTEEEAAAEAAEEELDTNLISAISTTLITTSFTTVSAIKANILLISLILSIVVVTAMSLGVWKKRKEEKEIPPFMRKKKKKKKKIKF